MKTILITLLLCITLQSFAPNISHFKRVKLTNEQKVLSHKEKIIKAIIIKESGGNSVAYNKHEDAVGILQLKKIYVLEVNRISNQNYKYIDRWDIDKSVRMFILMANHYVPTYSLDSLCALHNGGGLTKYDFIITKKYKQDIELILKTL